MSLTTYLLARSIRRNSRTDDLDDATFGLYLFLGTVFGLVWCWNHQMRAQAATLVMVVFTVYAVLATVRANRTPPPPPPLAPPCPAPPLPAKVRCHGTTNAGNQCARPSADPLTMRCHLHPL